LRKSIDGIFTILRGCVKLILRKGKGADLKNSKKL
jgi:hypothetical protein